MRTLLVTTLVSLAFVVLAPIGWTTLAHASPLPAGNIVGSCTPEIVHPVLPGTVDATSSGAGAAAVLSYTDARVTAPGNTDGAPLIGGDLELDVATAAGESLTFTATCIAGSGANPIGLVVYANGLTRGWPGSKAVRRSFVHFEAWTYSREDYAYVALIDSIDCKLNFDVNVVTRSPYVVGTGVLAGLPNHAVYAETDCSRRFGDPFPRSLVPGLNLP